ERALDGDSLEQLPDAPGDVIRRSRRLPFSEQAVNRFRRGSLNAELGSRRELFQDLNDRPVGDAFSVRETASAADRCALDGGQELRRQARLADTRGAENREQVAGALRVDVREGVPEQRELPVAPDHGRLETAFQGFDSEDGYETMGPDRLGLSLERHGLS